MVSGGLTLTMCSGTPTETEVVRWRALLVGACCGVEFLVVSVGQFTWIAVRVVQCGALWYIVGWFLSRWWCVSLVGRIVIETKKEKNRVGGLESWWSGGVGGGKKYKW